ncbi:tRNA lysidine(34) synthetase TilS [bacterium]|nr:tRNA lysidine(34) synthetase TilS [bacterium]
MFKSFLQKYNIDNPGLTYLVGFSGGPDSMLLLDALHKSCENKIIAIHLNHNWRGEESDKEEENCAIFCKKIGVEFYSEKINVSHSETAARKVRYDFFERCSKKFDSKIIFTAHNKNDNAETIMFRICHGTGIFGLQGINEKRGIYYRPILNISRDEIENYCKVNGLNPNIDSSNSDKVHKRNLIRSEILPLMEKVHPGGGKDALGKLSLVAQEDIKIIQEYVNYSLEKISKNGKICTDEFLRLSQELQKRILYEIITPIIPGDYDRERILIIWDFIKENSKSKSGKTISITTDEWFFVSEKYMELIGKTEKKDIYVEIQKTGEYKVGRYIFNISECNSISNEYSGVDGSIIYVDLSAVTNLVFRNRCDGDIIQVPGMNGHKKLKKYLNDRKIPNHEKDQLIFLASGNEILWAVGLGLSEKIKVKTKPTHRIELRLGD